MINTIFYFAPTYNEYKENLDSGEISARTIVFVGDQRAIYKGGLRYGIMSDDDFASILRRVLGDEGVYNIPLASTTAPGIVQIDDDYLTIAQNGLLGFDPTKLYNDPGFTLIINNYFQLGNLVIPTASATVKGGIKVGSGLKMDGDTMNLDFTVDPVSTAKASTTKYGVVKIGTGIGVNDGVISVDFSTPAIALKASTSNYGVVKIGNGIGVNDGVISVDFTNPPSSSAKASTSQYGVVKIGSGINVNDGVISVNLTKGEDGKDGKDGVDGRDGRDGRDGVDGASYDDTSLRNRIAALEGQTLADISKTDAQVRAMIEAAYGTFATMVAAFPDGGSWSSNSFGKSDVEDWVSEMGLVTVDKTTDPHTYTVGWSTLTQNYNTLDGRVTQVEGALANASGTIDYNLLQSGLYAYIRDNYTTAGMQSTWAKFMQVSDTDLARLAWMSSGVSTYANDSTTFANLMAAAQEYDQTGKTLLQQAAAKINAMVTKDANDNYVATATLNTLVNDKVNNALSTAGVLLSSDITDSSSALYSKFNEVQSSISTRAGYEMEQVNGQWVKKNYGTALEPEYRLESTISMSADKINITSNFIDALNSDLTVKKLQATKTVGNDTFTTTVNNDGISCGVSGYTGFAVSSNGNGSIAGGKISWTSANNGTVNFDSSVKVLALEAINANNNKTRVDSTGLRIYAPDGSTEVHRLNTGGQFSFGSGKLSYGSGTGVNVTGDFAATGDIHYGGSCTQSSDENLKNIQSTIDVAIEDIADTRIVNYILKNDEDDVLRSGTIAQDWQNLVPAAVKEYNNHLTLDYSAISIVSAVTAAREIVSLKEENAQLKARLDAIEARLAQL